MTKYKIDYKIMGQGNFFVEASSLNLAYEEMFKRFRTSKCPETGHLKPFLPCRVRHLNPDAQASRYGTLGSEVTGLIDTALPCSPDVPQSAAIRLCPRGRSVVPACCC
jgi:hypothetical protein